MIEIKFTVDDAIIKKALTDPQLVAGPVREFFRLSAFEVEKRAKELAPRDKGFLWGSIRTDLRPTSAIVAPHADPYDVIMELGSKPHMIRPKNKLALAFQAGGKLGRGTRRRGRSGAMIGGGEMIVVKSVRHPGTKPHPYMRPALEQSISKIQGFLSDAAKAIEEKWRQHGR